MKRLLVLWTLSLSGCATLCVKKDCYQATDAKTFMVTVDKLDKPPGTRFWTYVGSDDEYDYIYSFIGEVFPGHNYNYTYYKIKTGEINVDGPRFDFNPKPGSNRGILYNDAKVAEMNEKFGLTGSPSTTPSSTVKKAATP